MKKWIVSLLTALSFGASAQTKPNMVFILPDDHSAHFAGAYGYPDIGTPNIDRLASEGIKPTFRQPAQPVRDYVFAVRGAHGSGLPVNTAHFDLCRTIIGPKYKLIYNALWQLPYTPVDFAAQPFWLDLTRQHAEGKLDKRTDRLLFSPRRELFELYDLEKDPHEFENLAGQQAYREVEQAHKARLHEWMILNHDYLPLPVQPANRY